MTRLLLSLIAIMALVPEVASAGPGSVLISVLVFIIPIMLGVLLGAILGRRTCGLCVGFFIGYLLSAVWMFIT